MNKVSPNPHRKLAGNECYCTGCGNIFSTENAFAAHRRYPECLTYDQFERVGLFWHDQKHHFGRRVSDSTSFASRGIPKHHPAPQTPQNANCAV